MNAKEFRGLVREMMAAQRRYFASREGAALDESKRLEQAVRDELAQGDEGQGLLFGGAAGKPAGRASSPVTPEWAATLPGFERTRHGTALVRINPDGDILAVTGRSAPGDYAGVLIATRTHEVIALPAIKTREEFRSLLALVKGAGR